MWLTEKLNCIFIALRGFPGGVSGKKPACQCWRHKRHRVGKIPWRRAWQPIPVFLPAESHGQRSLAGYSPWGSQRVGYDWSDLAHKHSSESFKRWTSLCDHGPRQERKHCHSPRNLPWKCPLTFTMPSLPLKKLLAWFIFWSRWIILSVFSFYKCLFIIFKDFKPTRKLKEYYTEYIYFLFPDSLIVNILTLFF